MHYNKAKLIDGTADATAAIAADIGVKANALRVAPANNITDATYIGDIKFGEAEPNSAAIKTAVELLDDSIYVDDADWSDGVSKHILTGGLYQSAPQSITDGDVGPFQVDVNGCLVLGTGAKAIGKLAANTGVDIGDVDVTSIVPGVAATNLGKAEDAGHTSGDVGVMALSVRQNAAAALSGADADYQPLITDANGRLHVLDANTANMLTALQIIDDWDDADYCNVNMNIAGTDVAANAGVLNAQTLRVTIATDDECNNFLGTIDADTGNMVTALQIMDDWDAVHASAAASDGPQIMGAAYSAALPTDVGADADAARICTDRFGRILAGLMPQAFQATFNSADAQAAAPVKAKTASRKMYILSLTVSTDTAMNIKFQDDSGPTVLIQPLYFAANGGAVMTFPPEAPLVCGTNFDFDIVASAAGNVSVTITGYLAV